MKRLLGFLIPLLTITLTGCNNNTELKYRKQITDIQYFGNKLHDKDGNPTNVSFKLVVGTDLSYVAIYHNFNNNYSFEFRNYTKWFKKVSAFNFSYNYYYTEGNTLRIGKESQYVVFYELQNFKGDNGERTYFLYGLNRPKIVFTNETVGPSFMENSKTTVYAEDNDGKEVSMKGEPVFNGYVMLPFGSPDCEWVS